MKNILSGLLICIPCLSMAQWIEKSTSAAGFYNLTVLNEDTIFTCESYAGSLLRSIDGGVTWDTSEFANAWDFKIQFLNDSVGFIGGIAHFITGPTYYKTTDYGQNWEPINFNAGGGNPYHSLFFVNEDIGFVSDGDTVFKTTNGGISFNAIIFPVSAYFLVGDIEFIDENRGYVSLSHKEGSDFNWRNRIYKTDDQGANWTEIYSDTEYWDTALVGNNLPIIKNIHFSDENEGYFTGIAGKIIKTADGGTSWTVINTPIANKAVSDLNFINVDTGFMIIEAMLYRSINKGLDWNSVMTPYDSLLRNVVFLDANKGFISGWKLYETESGTTLSNIQTPNIKSQFRIYPNPASNIIHIEFESSMQIESIQMSDISGRVVKHFSKDKTALNISDIPAGVYLLNVCTKEGNISERVIIH